MTPITLIRQIRCLSLVLLIVLALLSWRPPAPTSAAFPGANGKIAFTSSPDLHSEIYVMNVDGSGQTRLTYSEGLGELMFNGVPDWQPLEATLLFLPIIGRQN